MQDSDFKWFLDHYDELFEKYGRSYLAIKNEKVLGKYNSYAEGVKNTEKTEELGTFIVQQCDGTKNDNMNHIASMDEVLV